MTSSALIRSVPCPTERSSPQAGHWRNANSSRLQVLPFPMRVVAARDVVCRATQPEASGEELSSQFSQFLNEQGVTSSTRRGPSHLLPPTTVVSTLMDALQRNDYPEADSGVKVAFSFSKPRECEEMLPGQTICSHTRSWMAKEEYVDFDTFSRIVHEHPYGDILNFDSWEPISEIVFPSTRFPVAVQAVQVSHNETPQKNRFTFCMERIEKGPYKGCWLTVGVRIGDYANV
ncbi:hypothetical protein BSKO_04433 [Bryopsis sp. KO-2023]|nr:hypothetical protein BSKO_04433 [Bryopsis sp. KO-2023]